MNNIVNYKEKRLHDNMIAQGLTFTGNYNDQILKSMKFSDCEFKGVNFCDAAVTGTKFDNCIFDDCDMDQGDFEYCDFGGGKLSSDKPVSISFNNSNFIGIIIDNIPFYSSTFTNAFFDGVTFNNVSIKNCTLEAASFYHCNFNNTSLNDLNLSFSEFVDSDFSETAFPLHQILNTFGMIQYMLKSSKPISLCDHKGNHISDSDSYVNNELPKILNQYLDMDSMNLSSKYFQLINILLAYSDKDKAVSYLRDAIREAATINDLRMIRYYCKLISFSELFTASEKRKLYRDISSNFHLGIMSPWQIKNYSRQMGEIRYTLLTENNLPTLIYYAITNLKDEVIEKSGILVKHILSLADKYKTTPAHDIKIEITKNSPLCFTIYFTETIENITGFFKDLNVVAGLLQNDDNSSNQLILQKTKRADIREYLTDCLDQDISFKYIGCHIDNWKPDYSKIFQLEG